MQTEIYIKMRSTLPKSKITLEREQFLKYDKMMLWKSQNIDRHQFVCQVSSISFYQPISTNLKNNNLYFHFQLADIFGCILEQKLLK